MGQVNIYLSLLNDVLMLRDDSGNNPDRVPVTAGVTSKVGQNDVVFWRIDDPGSGITIINDVSKKPGSQDIFSAVPHNPPSQTWWTGVVSRTATGIESYNITANGVLHDPKLQIH